MPHSFEKQLIKEEAVCLFLIKKSTENKYGTEKGPRNPEKKANSSLNVGSFRWSRYLKKPVISHFLRHNHSFFTHTQIRSNPFKISLTEPLLFEEDKCNPHRRLQELLLLLIIISCNTLQESQELLAPVRRQQSPRLPSSHTRSAKAPLTQDVGLLGSVA